MLSVVREIVLAAGWRRRLIAMAAGAAGALALAPIDFPPGMVLSLCVAVWLIDGAGRAEGHGRAATTLQPRSLRAAAGAGWWWGFGYFLAGFWWLGAAFLVEPAQFAWALPIGVIGVPAGLALFPALGFGAARLVWSRGATRVLALTAGLGLSECARSWILTGFPWNNYGMTLGDHLWSSQIASVVGSSGLTLLTLLVCAAPATLADRISAPMIASSRLMVPTLAAALLAVGIVTFGIVRIPTAPSPTVPNVRLRIMQPNTPQNAEFSYANREKILADYLALSDRATSPTTSGLADVTHLIWPESAFPFILSRAPDALETIGKALPAQTILITGAARADLAATESGDNPHPTYFNSIQVVGRRGTILDSYDKVHLVPFGEYLPLARWLRGIGFSNFVQMPGGFTAGQRRRLLDVPGLPPVSPVICYEAIFSGSVMPDASGTRAGVILNVTNDGWFGTTSGPYQHFEQARLRAVEEGVPLVRAANTGISAIIDPFGRIVASLPLNTRNVLDSALPVALAPTFFTRFDFLMKPFLLVFVIASAVAGRLTRPLW